MLIKGMSLSRPIDATWWSLGSAASNPTKEPGDRPDLLSEVYGDGTATTFGGTSVRNTWPLARKSEPSKEMTESDLTIGDISEEDLLRFGAIGEEGEELCNW